MQLIEEKDPHLWKIAQKRAAFKSHLGNFIMTNAFLWILWLLTEDNITISSSDIPWPAWATLSWGVWVVWEYYDAYHDDKKSNVEEEYRKLKKAKEERP